MDQFVANEVRMPAARRDDQAVGSDVVGTLAGEAVCLGALACGTEDGSGNPLNAANVLTYKGHSLFFECGRFGEARQLIDTDILSAAM